MKPEDPRHGTTAGHQAHLAAGERACSPCVAAKTRYEKVRHVYGDRMVPAIGTRRRVQALKALGYSGADIAARLGVTYQAVHKIERGTSPRIFAATANRIADVFEEMCMGRPNGYHVARMRSSAAAYGYLPPLAWVDIDDPDEHPDLTAVDTLPDPVVVERILSGDWRLKATATERAEVVAQWTGTLNELERLTGWNVARDQRQKVA